MAVAVVAVPLAVLVCVALARAVATANIRLLTCRKGRDLAVLSGLVIAVGAQFVNFGAQRLGDAGGLSALDPARTCSRWLPPASAIGAVESVSRGRVRAGRGPARADGGRVWRAAVGWWRCTLTS